MYGNVFLLPTFEAEDSARSADYPRLLRASVTVLLIRVWIRMRIWRSTLIWVACHRRVVYLFKNCFLIEILMSHDPPHKILPGKQLFKISACNVRSQLIYLKFWKKGKSRKSYWIPYITQNSLHRTYADAHFRTFST